MLHLTKPSSCTVSSLALVRFRILLYTIIVLRILLYTTSQLRVCSTPHLSSASALLHISAPPLLYTMTPSLSGYPFVPPTPGSYRQVRWHTFPGTRRLRGEARAHHQALRELIRSASPLAGPTSDYTYSDLILAASSSSIASAMGCLHIIWEEEHNVRTFFCVSRT